MCKNTSCWASFCCTVNGIALGKQARACAHTHTLSSFCTYCDDLHQKTNSYVKRFSFSSHHHSLTHRNDVQGKAGDMSHKGCEYEHSLVIKHYTTDYGCNSWRITEPDATLSVKEMKLMLMFNLDLQLWYLLVELSCWICPVEENIYLGW